jgi:hypothetical protein
MINEDPLWDRSMSESTDILSYHSIAAWFRSLELNEMLRQSYSRMVRKICFGF